MTESSAAAPPPYTVDEPPAEGIPPGTSQSAVSGTTLDGIRACILDNAPILFILGQGGYRTVPQNFKLVTIKASEHAAGSVPHLIHACVMHVEIAKQGWQEVKLFVQGPQRETTQAALLALLQKTQEMLGRRWKLSLTSPRQPMGTFYLDA